MIELILGFLIVGVGLGFPWLIMSHYRVDYFSRLAMYGFIWTATAFQLGVFD
jgi:hypothetical protein